MNTLIKLLIENHNCKFKKVEKGKEMKISGYKAWKQIVK